MNKDVNKRTESRTGHSIFARAVAAMLAVAMVLGLLSPMDGVVKAKAATTNTSVTVGEVTIEGTVGKPIKPQTIEITVENGTFDPVALYVGKDITEYFRPLDYIAKPNDTTGDRSSEGTFFREDTGISYKDGLYRTYYYAPVGLTINVAECTDTKLVCTVSGTPLSPSTTKLSVYLLPEMFATRTPQAINNSNNNVSCTTNGNWNITSSETGKASATLTCDTKNIEGTAGQTALNTQFTITLNNAFFALDLPAGTDVSVWFSGAYGSDGWTNQLPVDVTALLVNDVKMGDRTCTVKLSGTPRYGCYSDLCPTIPAQYIVRPRKDSVAYWSNYPIKGTSSVKFSITRLENEEPYMVANSANLYMYPMAYNQSGDSTWDSPSAARVYFCIYNGAFRGKESLLASAITGLTNNWVYSNQKGNTDTTSAEGFLYSPGGASGAEDHLNILTFKAASYYQNSGNTATDTQLSKQKKYYLSIKGTPYTVGEYPLSFFVPKNLLIDQDEAEGYTTVVIDKIPEKQGKLVIMNPLQLVFDNAQLQLKKGEVVDEYLTLKKSVYSRYIMKSSVTTENLKYTVSDDFKALGLDLEPVLVTPRSIIFHVTGTVKVKTAELDLSDAVSISYENFEGNSVDLSRFVEATINSNPNAKIQVASNAYGVPGQEIDYTEREDVIIYAKNKAGAQVSTVAINMTQEKLLLDGVTFAAYSTDGGKKWKAATSLADAAFAKLLQKGMTFVIATEFDAKTKKPTTDAEVYTFSKTEKAAAAPKFKVEFSTFADETGDTTGQFILTDKSGTVQQASTLRANYEIGIANSTGKSVDENGFGIWPVSGGLTVAGLKADGKATKTVYYIRTQATETTPASKIVKISVAGIQKAPKLKVDYKKESIKVKAGVSILCGEDYLTKNISKNDAKNAIELGERLTAEENLELKIWICANEKKPASAVQTITAAKRYDVSTLNLSAVANYDSSKHTVKLDKKFEAYDATKNKWGSLPKINTEGVHVVKVRRKADAKGGKESGSTFAASETVYLVITYGVYDSEKNKKGVISCDFSLTEPETQTE